MAVLVDDQRLHVQRRAPGRAGLADLVLGPQHGRQRRHLGLAVEVEEPHSGQPLTELGQHLDGHDGGAVVALAQRREVAPVEVGMVEQRDPHGRRAEQLRRALGLDGCEHRGGVGLRQQHVDRAEVDARREEAVQLRRVKQRQRVDLDVIGRHLPVDEAADVLRDEAAAREDRALRARLGAARVEQLDGVVVGQLDDRLGRVVVRRPAGDGLPAGLERVADHAAHGHQLLAPGGGDPGLGERQQHVLGDHRGRAGVVEDVRDLLRAEHVVDRHADQPEPRAGEVGDHEAERVVAQQREPVALREPALGERVGGAVDGRVQLRVRDAHVAVHDRGAAGVADRRAAQQVGHRLAPRGRDGAGRQLVERDHARTPAGAASRSSAIS